MGRRRGQPQNDEEAASPPRLRTTRAELEAELDERISKGEEILRRGLRTGEEVRAAQADFYTWNEYNAELLKHRFTTPEIAEEYEPSVGIAFVGPTSLAEDIAELHRDVQARLRRLRSIKERLPLYEEPIGPRLDVKRRSATSTEQERTIFIVHGRDDVPKLAVHGFLREVATAKPLILHDEPSEGRTVIEKFEDHAGDAVFAVILLTGDDVGGLGVEEGALVELGELKTRARQNVVFELGFFVGALGRDRVAILYEEGVELPSDLAGLAYIPLDDRAGWKLPLAKELQAAGVEIDPSKLLG